MTFASLVPHRMRRAAGAALLLAGLAAAPAGAADSAFDLPGPGLRVTVTRGTVTLPIAQLPDLAAGDRIEIHADLPEDQRTRFVLVSAFLSSATNPPPKAWIEAAETWKRKEKDRALTLRVPEGARQLVLFLVPETGGAAGTIADAVRNKPGEFVRAAQAINQASLDRSRLDAFVAAIRAQENKDPAHLKAIAPMLARSLAIKLNAECLDKVVEFQAACLLENRESLVLADMHSSSVAATLAGAPTDLALQLSYTREAGLGYYSQYIAVVRDIARLFGAFSTPQFRYLPALGLQEGERVALLLNAAPSFAKPKSVLVASMPAIGADSVPRLRATNAAPLCGADPNLVLPVEGAPLIYSTDYARNMVVRLNGADVALQARADRGGYVPRTPIDPSRFQGSIEGRLHGTWGYQALTGPVFALQFPTAEPWKVGPEAPSLVTGRDNPLKLQGAAPACVSSVSMRVGDGAAQPVKFTVEEGGVALTLPLKDARPGEVTLEIRQTGRQAPATVALRAYREASRVAGLTLHAGDSWGELTGQRLDQVARVELGGLRLDPDGLTREGDTDRLRLVGTGNVPAPGEARARVTLNDGRTLKLPVTVRPPRVRMELLDKNVRATAPVSQLPLVAGNGLLPDTARLHFSLRVANTTLSTRDAIEIAGQKGQTVLLKAGPNLQLQGDTVLVATLDPAALGPSAFGPLRFRLVREGEASDWLPLTTLARLPTIERVDCDAAGQCTLTGQSLFLIEAIAGTPSFDKPVRVPQGFTGRTIEVPVPQGGKLYLRLQDAPSEMVELQTAR